MNHVILLNGPPRSGKDEAGHMIAKQLHKLGIPFGIDKMIKPAEDIIKTVTQIDDYTFAMYREEKKDEKLPDKDVSLRQLMISFSEDFIKPNLGDDYLGIWCAERIMSRNTPDNYVTIITDTGFQVEHDALVNYDEYKMYHTVQIHRPVTSFDGDSREWVNGKDKTHVLKNDGSIELLAMRVECLLKDLEIMEINHVT